MRERSGVRKRMGQERVWSEREQVGRYGRVRVSSTHERKWGNRVGQEREWGKIERE